MRDLDPAGAMHCDVLSAARSMALAWAVGYADFDTADDVASEVAIMAWKRRETEPTFLDAPGELELFAVRNARTVLRTFRRGDWRRAQREAEAESSATERRRELMRLGADGAYSELAGAYSAALARQSFGNRAAYIMIAQEEMDYSSAAAHLGLTTQAVESRVKRTRRELRKELAQFRPGGPV